MFKYSTCEWSGSGNEENLWWSVKGLGLQSVKAGALREIEGEPLTEMSPKENHQINQDGTQWKTPNSSKTASLMAISFIKEYRHDDNSAFINWHGFILFILFGVDL